MCCARWVSSSSFLSFDIFELHFDYCDNHLFITDYQVSLTQARIDMSEHDQDSDGFLLSTQVALSLKF